jgi:hypothetical protein
MWGPARYVELRAIGGRLLSALFVRGAYRARWSTSTVQMTPTSAGLTWRDD